MFTKKKFVEYNFQKKNLSEKNSKNILKKNFEIFLYLKKNSVEIRLIFEKQIEKILKIIFAIFLFLKKKSVKSRLIHQSKNKKLSVKISVNLGYFRLKHRLHNLPGKYIFSFVILCKTGF